MFSRMNNYIQEQLCFHIPSFNEYAETSIKYLADYLDENMIIQKIKIEILIEPGTALASKAIDFVAQVVSIKKINDTLYKYNRKQIQHESIHLTD